MRLLANENMPGSVVELPAQCGVILFRLDGEDPDEDLRRMVEAVESRTDWTGTFAVVEQLRIRLRPLP